MNDFEKNILIVGTGLIGGSIALKMRQKGYRGLITGVETNEHHARLAIENRLVDQILPLEHAAEHATIAIICVPVKFTTGIALSILANKNIEMVMDVGSTKEPICAALADHPSRKKFVATHPMWGTEYSGPKAAVGAAFEGNTVVICEKERSSSEALDVAEEIYDLLGMKIVYMSAEDHDVHAAYVSHISHITSFALANTVLEKEKEDQAIFEMASGGFESTVRLAKSNPEMWLSIFEQNRENVLDVLNEHIAQLKKFRSCFEKENYDYMRTLIENANKIKRIIK